MDSAPPPRRSAGAWALILIRRIAFTLFVAASLLVFPASLPWMIAAWLALFAALVLGKKRAGTALVACLILVLVKRVDWTPGLISLGILMAAATAVERWRTSWTRPALAILAAAWIFMAWEWNGATHTRRRPSVDPARPVVCLGDSLSVLGFPRELKSRLRIPVVNLSAAGITAAQGLKRLPEALAVNPQTVVIELGGHDYLRDKPRAETKACLEKMIVDSRAIGAEVVLFEVPRGFVIDPYGGLERELARKYDLEIVGDGAIRQLVFFSPSTPLGPWTGRLLSYDGLHPNEAGHVWLADRVSEALRTIYGEKIFKDSP